jgi:hypothetical protein
MPGETQSASRSKGSFAAKKTSNIDPKKELSKLRIKKSTHHIISYYEKKKNLTQGRIHSLRPIHALYDGCLPAIPAQLAKS